jgi:hypothetical protein
MPIKSLAKKIINSSFEILSMIIYLKPSLRKFLKLVLIFITVTLYGARFT